MNRVSIRPILKRTPYELYYKRKPTISYFHIFDCICFVSNNKKDNLEKRDTKFDEAIFLGYSSISKAYKVFNIRTLVIEESIHVVFNEAENPSSKKEGDLDDVASKILDRIKELTLNDTEVEDLNEIQDLDETPQSESILPKEWKYASFYPKELTIGDPSLSIKTRSNLKYACNYLAFVFQIESKNFEEAEKDNN